jgi:hypothetical protein
MKHDLIVVRYMAMFAAAGLVVIGLAHLLLYCCANYNIGSMGIFLTIFAVVASFIIASIWIPFFGLPAVVVHWEAGLIADLLICGLVVGLIRARRQ